MWVQRQFISRINDASVNTRIYALLSHNGKHVKIIGVFHIVFDIDEINEMIYHVCTL